MGDFELINLMRENEKDDDGGEDVRFIAIFFSLFLLEGFIWKVWYELMRKKNDGNEKKVWIIGWVPLCGGEVRERERDVSPLNSPTGFVLSFEFLWCGMNGLWVIGSIKK